LRRLGSRLLTGPVGHFAGGVLDWLEMGARLGAGAARARAGAMRSRGD
jgi:hypothetical protein